MSIMPSKPAAKKRAGDKRPPRVRALAAIDRVAAGLSLRKACEAEGIDQSDVQNLFRKDEELRILYETAVSIRRDAVVDDLVEEGDAVMEKALKKGTYNAGAYVSAFVAKANIVKWEAERREPKKWGNRIDVNHSGSIDLAGRLAKARERTSSE